MAISVQVKRIQPGKPAVLANLFYFVTFAQKMNFISWKERGL
jgi:hypothetical protein